jgi:hypothetical protein
MVKIRVFGLQGPYPGFSKSAVWRFLKWNIHIRIVYKWVWRRFLVEQIFWPHPLVVGPKSSKINKVDFPKNRIFSRANFARKRFFRKFEWRLVDDFWWKCPEHLDFWSQSFSWTQEIENVKFRKNFEAKNYVFRAFSSNLSAFVRCVESFRNGLPRDFSRTDWANCRTLKMLPWFREGVGVLKWKWKNSKIRIFHFRLNTPISSTSP